MSNYLSLTDIMIGLLFLLGLVSIVSFTIGFMMDKKVLKIISFVAIILMCLTIYGVLQYVT